MQNKVIEKNADKIIKLAQGSNFWGKRLRDVKLGVCDGIIAAIGSNQKKLESSVLCDWLEENKPVKKMAKASKIVEPVEPTFEGSSSDRDSQLDVLPFGRYIVTAAQNNTKPHESFYTLKEIARFYAAELLVMPIHYIRALPKEQRKAISYHKDIKPYLVEDDCFLGNAGAIRLAALANVVPTAKKPVNNANMLNNGEAVTLVASPRNQLLSRGRAKTASESYAMTTRVCTVRHYEDCRAGSESSKDHFFGGVMFDVTPDGVEIQPLESNEAGVITFDGSEYYPTGGQYETENPVIVLGDLHIEKSDMEVWQNTVCWLTDVEPSLIVCHDTLDFSSRNHHNRASGRFLYQQGTTAVVDELTQVVNQLNELAAIAPLYIVASNHDDALSRWLDCPHYSSDQDPINAKTYHFLKLAILEMIDEGGDLEILELALQQLADAGKIPELAENIIFGSVDEGYQQHGFELSMHGHIGQGGARGSLATFKRYGQPNVTGHTHSGGRDGNALVVGVTGSYDMGYNKGMTTWTRDNAVIYPNGTAYLLPLGRISYRTK